MSTMERAFSLKAPCANCPFRREGAIELAPTRLQGIIQSLITDDHTNFPCHKSVHHPQGGEWTEDGDYKPSGNEIFCAGAMIYLEKVGRPSVAMRLARMHGRYDKTATMANASMVIDPESDADCPPERRSCANLRDPFSA